MKMKRPFLLALCLLLTVPLILGSCFTPSPRENGKKLSVVTTIFPPYDFVRQIAGDEANLKMLLKPGMESHSYEPSPSDIVSIQECDLFIYNGGESDTWVDDLLETIANPNIRIIKMMDCVEPLEEETVVGMQAHESGHAHEEEYDEHIWTSPVNAGRIVEEIQQALSDLDSENSAFYVENSTAYIRQLEELDAEIHDMVSRAKRRKIAFGDRFPFRYLADEYGLSYLAAFPGCSSESEPSAQTVASLVDTVRREQIPVVFYLEFSNHKIADTVAAETGVRTSMMHSCHNLSQQEMEEGATYLSLMTQNYKRLKEALN